MKVLFAMSQPTEAQKKIADEVALRFREKAEVLAAPALLFIASAPDSMEAMIAAQMAFLATLFYEGKIIFKEPVQS